MEQPEGTEPALKEPPWFTALVDQRMTDVENLAKVAPINAFNVVMSPLSEIDLAGDEPTEEDIKVWDETCDGCHRHVPGQLYSGSTAKQVGDVQVLFTFGVCEECRKGFV